MYKRVFARSFGLGLLLAADALSAATQGTSTGLVVKTIAEVEAKAELTPAERVLPGDYMIYTLEVKNVGPLALPNPTVTNPVPAHMRYIADSAVGPAAEVSFSVDGGRSFDRPESLRVATPGGGTRHAVAADYTHIRWQLRNTLQSQSVAFVRFRTLVK